MKQYNFVLIRGLGRSSEHWLNFPDQLKSSFPDSTINFIDLPGTGSRNHLSFPININESAKMVFEDYKEIQNEFEPILVGISLGGMISLALAKLYPKVFKKLILINSSTASSSPLYRLKPIAVKEFLKALGESNDYKRESIIYKLTSNQNNNQEVIKNWVRTYRSFPVTRENILRQILAASKFKVPENLTQNTLILCSRNDNLCHYNCSFKIHDHVPNSHLEFHSSAGHDIPLDDPIWLLNKFHKFLDT